MALPNIFTEEVAEEMIGRIERLSSESQRQWGKMDVARMLAHCCVSYEMIYEPDKHPKPNAIMGLILKYFAKNSIVNEKPIRRNIPTAPQFIMKSDKDFAKEKVRLIDYIRRTREIGEDAFDGKVSASFGKMNKTEWNNMLYKHLDHHLTQFGV